MASPVSAAPRQHHTVPPRDTVLQLDIPQDQLMYRSTIDNSNDC